MFAHPPPDAQTPRHTSTLPTARAGSSTVAVHPRVPNPSLLLLHPVAARVLLAHLALARLLLPKVLARLAEAVLLGVLFVNQLAVEECPLLLRECSRTSLLRLGIGCCSRLLGGAPLLGLLVEPLRRRRVAQRRVRPGVAGALHRLKVERAAPSSSARARSRGCVHAGLNLLLALLIVVIVVIALEIQKGVHAWRGEAWRARSVIWK
mmetsp:Transcript_41107/g.124475  ORF Transcript_41107/g.124475 Transcript_41107/m.124475 type:complete len:207 (+) Transcript_41107:169-789(+)